MEEVIIAFEITACVQNEPKREIDLNYEFSVFAQAVALKTLKENIKVYKKYDLEDVRSLFYDAKASAKLLHD